MYIRPLSLTVIYMCTERAFKNGDNLSAVMLKASVDTFSAKECVLLVQYVPSKGFFAYTFG